MYPYLLRIFNIIIQMVSIYEGIITEEYLEYSKLPLRSKL